jgi:hypothetical protein
MEVPPATHHAWSDLVIRKSEVQPTFLAARMLIVRAHMGLLRSKGAPADVQKFAAELRELFAQNTGSPSAQQDLTKIFG